MATVWITFATEDNVDGDVDFLAQEIARSGWRTRLHPMFPGEDEKIERLMPAFLARPEQSDAWIFVASTTSLENGRLEKIRSVLEQAVEKRGDFPTIGLFPNVDTAGSLPVKYPMFSDDPEWRTHLSKALGVDLPESAEGGLHPFVAKAHANPPAPYEYVIEFRPKFGQWGSFVFAVPPEEKARVGLIIQAAPKGAVPSIAEPDFEEGFSDDAEWYYLAGREPATPQVSYFAFLREMPTRMAFGQEGVGEVVILQMRARN